MKYALIDSTNTVVNIINYSSGPYTPPAGLTLTQVNDWVNIGDNKDKPEPIPTPTPVIVPEKITSLQFFIMAAISGIMTEAEAKTKTIPASIQAIFDTLTSEEKFIAEVRWAGMTEVPRTDPLVTAAAAALGMTSQQIDNFFIQASAL